MRARLSCPGPLAASLTVAAALFAGACERDVYVGASPSAGGLPNDELTRPPPGPADDRSPADTFAGTWRSAALGVEGLAGFRVVTGDLIVTELDAVTWAPFDLEQVGGDLVVCGSDVLENLNLSALTDVGGRLRVCDAPLLDSLTLSGLITVGGELVLERVPGLRIINVTALEAAGGVGLRGIGAASLSLPGLLTLDGDLVLAPRDSSELETLSVPALTELLGNLEVREHPTLRSLVAPALVSVGGALIVEGNPELRTLELGALAHVGAGGCVCDNSALPACAAAAVADVDGGVVDEEGNTGSGSCPE